MQFLDQCFCSQPSETMNSYDINLIGSIANRIAYEPNHVTNGSTEMNGKNEINNYCFDLMLTKPSMASLHCIVYNRIVTCMQHQVMFNDIYSF